jgi:hypothetical protein
MAAERKPYNTASIDTSHPLRGGNLSENGQRTTVETPSRHRQLLTGVLLEVQTHMFMTGATRSIAINNLFNTPENHALQELRLFTQREADVSLHRPALPPPSIEADKYIDKVVDGVSQEVRSNMRNNNIDADTAARDVFGTLASPSLQEVKRIISLAVEQSEKGSTPEDALTEAAVIVQWQKGLANKQLSATDRYSIPEIGEDQHFTARVLAGDVDSEEYSRITNLKKADRRSPNPPGSASEVAEIQRMLKESYDGGYITAAEYYRESVMVLIDGATAFAAEAASKKQETGEKPSTEDFVTVINKTDQPTPSNIGSHRALTIPGTDTTTAAELYMWKAPDNADAVERALAEAFERLNKDNGVIWGEGAVDIVERIIDRNTHTINGATILDQTESNGRVVFVAQTHLDKNLVVSAA